MNQVKSSAELGFKSSGLTEVLERQTRLQKQWEVIGHLQTELHSLLHI